MRKGRPLLVATAGLALVSFACKKEPERVPVGNLRAPIDAAGSGGSNAGSATPSVAHEASTGSAGSGGSAGSATTDAGSAASNGSATATPHHPVGNLRPPIYPVGNLRPPPPNRSGDR
jgi:hypothetical protein